MTPEQRLLDQLTKEPIRGCWLWTGGLCRGYGRMRLDGKVCRSHVASYRLFCGPTNGLFVLHSCDVTMCCNPTHLFLGTQADNVKDAQSKWRIRHGNRHKSAKLKDDDVKEIRRLHRRGELGLIRLGKKFGVGPKTIQKIVRGQTWRHLLSEAK